MSTTGVKVDASRVVRKLQGFPGNLREALTRTLTAIGYDLTGYIQQNKLQGQVLHHRTGNLSSHVHPQTTSSGTTISTTVGVDASAVPYAAIHEFGGYIAIPEVTGKLMVFGPEPVFTQRHQAFTVHMPERSFMRSALADKRAEYLADIDGTIAGAVQQ